MLFVMLDVDVDWLPVGKPAPCPAGNDEVVADGFPAMGCQNKFVSSSFNTLIHGSSTL